MSRNLVAQIFPTGGTFIPTKAALHLQPAGLPSSAFVFNSTTDAVIDAVNFATLTQNSIKAFLDDSTAGYTGAGSIATDTGSGTGSKLTYPIQSSEDGKYTLWLRIHATASYSIGVAFDNTNIGNLSGSSTGWTWVSINFVSFDSAVHTLSISLNSAGVNVDKLVISKSTTPTSTGPSFTTAPYVTVTARIFATDVNHLPTTAYKTLGYVTSTDVTKEGWYNFDLTLLEGTQNMESYQQLAVVVLSAGSSNTHYVMWDYANDVSNPVATNDDSGWVLDTTTSMAIRVYSDHPAVDEYNCTLVTPDANIVVSDTESFEVQSLRPQLENTAYVTEGDDQKVELNVGPKKLSIVIDQSGSQSWNDNSGLRFQFANSVLDVLEAKYPADVNFNLTEFKGEPCFSFFIPLTQQITSGNLSDIVKAFFADDSSNFAGFRVIRKEGGYSTSPIDGEIVFDGYALAALDTDLKLDTNYYYTVFTYDQQLRFSKGVQVQATTHDLSLPRGVPNFTGQVEIGYDVKWDSSIVGQWNMDEGSGDFAADFAGSELLSLTNTQWLSVYDSPAGLSGLRFNGVNSEATTVNNSNGLFLYPNAFTVMFWVYRFTNDTNMYVLGRGNSTDTNYSFKLQNGLLKVSFLSYTGLGSVAIPSKEWTHVAITFANGTLKTYVNGVLANTQSLASVSPSANWAQMAVNIGVDPTGASHPFFGKVSHLTIHDVERSASYILNAANPDRGTDSTGATTEVENGDRVIALQYVIPTDFNFETVRIVRNDIHLPNNELDGTIVWEKTATAGKTELCVSYPYDVTEKYYFRLFTQNALGNWCPIEDASSLTLTIPDVVRPAQTVQDIEGNDINIVPGPGFGTTDPVNVLVHRNGNEKVYFKWATPTGEASRVKIYYSADQCPSYDDKTKTIVGTVIFDEPISVTEFVHRGLANQQPGYYVLVTVDRLMRFSHFSCYTMMPLANYDDSGIPLLEAQNVHYNLVDYDRIRISWDSPVSLSSTKQAYFDDRFYIYAGIADLYGNPIPFQFPDLVSITTNLTGVNTASVEDAFHLGIDTSQASKIPSAQYTVNGNGLITGIVRLIPNPLFAVISSINLAVSVSYKLSDQFTYKLPDAQLNFKNPLEMTLINRDSQYFSTIELAPPDGCVTDAASGASGAEDSPLRKRVNGVYVRRKAPFTVRAQLKYKGLPVRVATTSVRIFDGTTGPCSIKPTNLVSTSKTVKLFTNSFPVVKQTIPIADAFGNPTVFTQDITYVDIPVVSPQLPQSAVVYVRMDGNGYTALGKMNVYFANILKIRLSANAPDSDNIDIKEEFATAYLVDPDDPENQAKFTFPPDLTVAKWALYLGEKTDTRAHNVPFYSADNVPLQGGIYSYFRNGTARNVFMGPTNPSAAGEYTIVVSTTVRGLFAQTQQLVTILGRSSGEFNINIPDPTKPRILAEFPETVNYLWADGVHYVKMAITRNPTVAGARSNTKYSDKFRECSSVLFPLPPGTVVTVDAKGYEILWGDVAEITTTDGVPALDDSNAIRSVDTAQVTLSTDPYTYVYFRKNAQITKRGCFTLSSAPCAAFDAPSKVCFDPYSIGSVTEAVVSTKINFAGKPATIFGGGGFNDDGRPPCLLVPVEPLYLSFLGLFVNNIPVNDFSVDGSSVAHMIFEVRFAGQPLPADVPIAVYAVDLSTPANEQINARVGVPLNVYTFRTTTLPGGVANPTNQTYALFDIPVGPLDPKLNYKLGVYPDVIYDGPVPLG